MFFYICTEHSNKYTLSRFDDASLCINLSVFNPLIATLRDQHCPNRITVSHSHLSPFMKPSLGLGFDLQFLLGYRVDMLLQTLLGLDHSVPSLGLNEEKWSTALAFGEVLMPLLEKKKKNAPANLSLIYSVLSFSFRSQICTAKDQNVSYLRIYCNSEQLPKHPAPSQISKQAGVSLSAA